LIAPLPSSSSSAQAADSRVIKYSSQLKLVFSLLNEDCTQSGFIRSWSIKHAIERQLFKQSISPINRASKLIYEEFLFFCFLVYLEDLLASFAPLHNLTCQTQILQHSPLAFEPTVVANGDQATYVVEQEELKAFINDADWNLGASPMYD
jgi:phosphatidylinositol glycan class S